jgi:hypothetical protein
MPHQAFRRGVPNPGELLYSRHVLAVESPPPTIDFDVVGTMFTLWKSFEVFSAIVEWIAVGVVDVPSGRYCPDFSQVDLDVERLDSTVSVRLSGPIIDTVLPARAVRAAGEDNAAIGDSLGLHVHMLSP